MHIVFLKEIQHLSRQGHQNLGSVSVVLVLIICVGVK